VPADVLTRLRARGHIGVRLGLERMRSLLAELGDPQLALRGALVAGTNGKGSTVAMAASMLASAGYSTATSPSPHLSSYRERIMVDGQPIAAADLDELLEEVVRAGEAGEADHGPATEFELLTAAAYLEAARRGVDVMVMEVGLGGRLDATNAWAADVAAITGVGLDHRQYLGDTVAAIAREKAAIIKAGCRAVTGAEGDALEVIASRAREVGAPLRVCVPLSVERMDGAGLTLQHPRLGRVHLPLPGRHQAHNAAVALGIVDACEEAGVVDVPDAARLAGLERVRWPGRLELVDHEGTTVLLDGAHNPDGAIALARAVDELAPFLPAGRMTLLLGIMADKAVADVLEALAGSRVMRAGRVVTTAVPDTERTLSAGDLAAAWVSVVGSQVEAASESADAALARALEIAVVERGPLVVSGSLYLVGHVRARLVGDPDAPAD
jgi:dihydrofolate synthase/folylpolyglutamate synthase